MHLGHALHALEEYVEQGWTALGHGAESLVPAWPKAAPGLPRHFAL